MFNILTLNKIAAIGTDRLGANYTIGDAVENPDAVLVRSASMHDMEMPESLLAIARAGAGTNNIPVDKCAEEGIVVFNTPGANANAVKELVIAGLFLASRDIVGGIDWAKGLKGKGAEVGKLVEKGKSQFVGPEITGKKLGVIGLGAIGILVANAAVALGMEVYGYDPFLSVDAAWKLNKDIVHAASTEEIFKNCDYITVHIPLNDKTKHTINADTLAIMKDGVRILNYSRDGLVDSTALLEALKSGKVAKYVTDFATDDILCEENVICMPHLGASTPESEDNCAVMAADEIKDYLENGNIVNSVNYPALKMARSTDTRICVLHYNKPNVIATITSTLAAQGANIENMESKSRGDYGYMVIDVVGSNPGAVKATEELEDVIRVRVIE
ncbi:MAG: ACT domain-containing protein [Ruminococcaceae bacterium]|nr:ACT domain-containing protein [Oscillospiraceae bacterium]